MTQEEKKILLVDLSARLSYGVICHTEKGDGHLCSINQTIFGTEYGVNIKATKREYFNDREEVIKPYLRPMSSMTEEENKIRKDYYIYHFSGNNLPDNEGDFVFEDEAHEYIDWLNKNHFDYLGLIGRGLAIAVTEENNPYEK